MFSKALIFTLIVDASATATQAMCTAGFIDNGATAVTGKTECANANEVVGPTSKCAADPCGSADAKMCCKTKIVVAKGILFQSNDAGCGTPSTAPSAGFVKTNVCHATGAATSMKTGATCPAAGATKMSVDTFTDATCGGTATALDVTYDTCTTVAGVDLKLLECAEMLCSGDNAMSQDCEAVPKPATTTAANNTTTSDNAVSGSIAGAALVSAAALVFA